METSEQVNELFAALAKAQGEFKPASKSKTNPHLGNKYATLDDIIEVVRVPLSENELSFMQLLHSDNDVTYLETILAHSSGQYISDTVKVASTPGNRGVNELQTLGGGLTYMKRYALSALLGISTEDDTDGNKPDQKPFDVNAVTKSTFLNDWGAMLDAAKTHLPNVTSIDKAKAAIKAKFENATVLQAWEYLRDEYAET